MWLARTCTQSTRLVKSTQVWSGPAPSPTLEYSLFIAHLSRPRHQIYSLQSGPVHSTSLCPVFGGILNSVLLAAIPYSGRLLPSAASIRAHAHPDTLHSLGPDSTLINPSFSSSTQSIHSVHPTINLTPTHPHRAPSTPPATSATERKAGNPLQSSPEREKQWTRNNRTGPIVARIGYLTASKVIALSRVGRTLSGNSMVSQVFY